MIGKPIRNALKVKSQETFALFGLEGARSNLRMNLENCIEKIRNSKAGKKIRGLKDQAKEGAWGMPWYQEPKKDVASCEKPRGDANSLRSVDVRMGKPRTRNRV